MRFFPIETNFVQLCYENFCGPTPSNVLSRSLSSRVSNPVCIFFKHLHIHRNLQIKLVIGKLAAALTILNNLSLFRSTNNWPTMFYSFKVGGGQESRESNYRRLLAVAQKAI